MLFTSEAMLLIRPEVCAGVGLLGWIVSCSMFYVKQDNSPMVLSDPHRFLSKSTENSSQPAYLQDAARIPYELGINLMPDELGVFLSENCSQNCRCAFMGIENPARKYCLYAHLFHTILEHWYCNVFAAFDSA